MSAFASTQSEQENWERKFRDGSHSSDVPDDFFVFAYQEYINPLLGDRETRNALDVASGVGRHGLWLAERGWQATLVDIATEGLDLARRRSRGRNLEVDFSHRDLREVTSARAAGWEERFDLVLGFFYLQRDLFPVLADALKPGGLLVYKTYTDLQPLFGGGPTHEMHLLKSGELLHAFPSLRVLHYHETVRDRGVAELLAIK